MRMELYVCSYECTFCRACTEEMGRVCPNCGGELVGRPRRGGGCGGEASEGLKGGVVGRPYLRGQPESMKRADIL